MTSSKFLLMMGWRRLSFAVALSACMMCFTSCDKYDLDKTDPEGWGASIYSYLAEDGHYTNTIRLIEDLGQKEVLAKTGSKTLFVADDDAFARFFSNNKWGVSRYEQLSESQKKLLLYGSMINNSYQINTLSSVGGDQGIIEGACVRRSTASTIYDSVQVVKVEDLPSMRPEDRKNNSCWAKFGDRKSVVLMNDLTTVPMVHFVEDFIANNHFLNSDINFLFNGKIDRKPGDAIVNGVNVGKMNIKCSNGFIHKLDEVALPLDNMAQLIANNPETSEFSKLLERFSAPYYVGKEITDRYNLFYNTNVDSVFQKRYFSLQARHELNTDDDNKVHQDLLEFDPGWNRYYINDEYVSGSDDELAVNRDMAFILAPTNEALAEYWKNGAGRILIDQYGTVENIPNDVVKELINNNFKVSFRSKGVQSKFPTILNDANDPMDVDPSKVKEVMVGCNGTVYVMNSIYSPTAFVSVKYPTVVNKTMKLINWAIDQNQYTVYLNSLNAYYSFFIPTNKAMLEYVNPATYGKMQPELYRFHYDETMNNPVWASVFAYNMETHEVGDSIGEIRNQPELMKQILKDVLDNCIVVNKNVEDGHEYYLTKAGTALRVRNVKAGVNGMTVEGSFQVNDSKKPLYVTEIYDQSANPALNKAGNGKCYILDSKPIMTTKKSVMEILGEHEEMSEMFKLFYLSGIYESIRNKTQAAVSGANISVFNSYHYTVYVPTNEAIKELQAQGKLPTYEQVQQEQANGNTEVVEQMQQRIADFVRLHIQDNAMFIGANPIEREKYETACLGSNGKFERIYVTLGDDNISIQINADDKNPAKVVKKEGLYNLQAREYFVPDLFLEKAQRVATSSSAVVHLIDKALYK